MNPHDLAWLDSMDHLQELLLLAEPLEVTRKLTRCLNVLFTLQGLRYTTALVIGQRLESARLDWHNLSAAYQQLSFSLAQTHQENDRLCARRFQWELERGDRLQRIVDLEAEVITLQEDVDANDIENLTLLQNITEMQQQVEEAEVQIATLQAVVALQPLPPVDAPQRSSRVSLVLTRRVRLDPRHRPHLLHLLAMVLRSATRLS
jgi:hypothetical protein